MADSKITALGSIGTGTDPANDQLVIVDVSDVLPTGMATTGTTKRVSLNNLLASSPTATLASATITGDLTVDTSTLKVDSTNNRVGIVQATPLYPLHLVGEFGLEEASSGNGTKLRLIGDASKYNFRLGKQLTATNTFEITPSTAVGGTTFSNPVYTVTNDGIHTFLDGAGGTRMTLNSTGLGIGDSPSYKLHVAKTTDGTLGYFRRISGSTNPALTVYCNETGNTVGFGTDYAGATSPSITFTTGGSERLRIDASGNLILQSSATPATLGTNGMLTVNATSNTNLRFSYRGSDGTTRVANITLA